MRWLLVLLFACSSPSVRIHYPTVPDQPTGTLVILLSQEASDVTVAVNGNLCFRLAMRRLRLKVSHPAER